MLLFLICAICSNFSARKQITCSAPELNQKEENLQRHHNDESKKQRAQTNTTKIKHKLEKRICTTCNKPFRRFQLKSRRPTFFSSKSSPAESSLAMHIYICALTLAVASGGLK
jgi:hypothetical protein